MNEINVRRRLPRDLLWVFGLCCVYMAFNFVITTNVGLGVDSHASWASWRGDMYGAPPATIDAYLYSPAFAQLIWPFVQLPWPMFGTLWSLGILGILWWLVRVCDWYVAVPLFLLGTHEVLTGNINALMALVVVFGLRYPWLWALPFLTKITSCLGPVWFLARGEWRNLFISVGTICGVIGASWMISPDLWSAWLSFLRENSGRANHQLGGSFLPPLVMRLPLALALTIWGARYGRVWTIPVAMFFILPVAGPGQLVLFMTLPRLAQKYGNLEPVTKKSPVPIASSA